MTGHCSKCGKIWMLEQRQGICPWCNQLAICQSSTTKPRHIKSSPKRSRRQAQTEVNGNGYDQLDGKWLTYYRVASKFSHKAQAQDREDLLHDVMVTLADVARNNGHKPFTEVAMCRIASVTLADYWREQYKITNGIDCGSCSKTQRQKCRRYDLYTECPKAVKLEYLSKPITDGEGNLTELGELIADDHAIDLDAWVDADTFIRGCPQRLVDIAHKRVRGIPLDNADMIYLCRYRQKEQKRLIE
jgi:uncharacterized Zn finger protein (UPF0148 family)